MKVNKLINILNKFPDDYIVLISYDKLEIGKETDHKITIEKIIDIDE